MIYLIKDKKNLSFKCVKKTHTIFTTKIQHSDMYIIVSYNLCSLHGTMKFKLIALLCTNMKSYVFSIVHPRGSIYIYPC